MKNIVLISNHGNHIGFNRTWTIDGQFDNLEDAKKLLLDRAFNVSDDIIESNGLPFDNSSQEVVYDGKSDSFSYDGKMYTIITEEDYNNVIFDGGHYGYAPKEVVEYFEN